MKRRDFLKHSAWLGSLSLLPLCSGWALASEQATQQRLVVVFLRGAVDGLSVVVPWADSNYYAARDSIALPKAGSDGGVLDLDGYFGLHPALAGVLPLWQAGQLAFVQASGSPDPSRSHFDAQDFMESGTPGDKNTVDGWLNRLLARLPGPHSPTQGLSVGDTLPRIFQGPQTVATMAYGKGAAKPMAVDRPKIGDAFDRLYSGDDALGKAYREGRAAHAEIMASMDDSEQAMANNGAPDAKGFVLDAGNLGQLLRRDPRIQVAFTAAGGWDTHVGQGSSKGQLADRLQALGDGLAALAGGLGSDWQNTAVVVMSEFGRTVHENGNKGTDHGHGNVMWVLGGGVRGGKVYGDWPGLDAGALYEGRDLAVTTDFRQVLASVLGPHFGLHDRDLRQLFPGMPKAHGSLALMNA